MKATTMRAAFLLFSSLVLTMPMRAQDYFINSDDYKDGDEIVNVFLKAEDYQLMVEDIERNGESFDWGWVKTPIATGEPAATKPTSRTGRLLSRLRRGGHNPAEPKELGFQLKSYKTVSIPKVENYSGLIPPTLQEAVRYAFVLAMKEIGIETVDNGISADLLLEVAIVDFKRDSTYIYVTTVQPCGRPRESVGI